MPKDKKPTKIKELVPDSRNMNKGNEFGNSLIEKSFRKFGAGRSILLDKNNKIIAGNKSIEACAAVGLEDVIIVETTGQQVVAVKRTDIDLDTPDGREMALADNASAKENIEWDNDTMAAISKEFGINTDDWGISMDELFPPDAEEDNYHIPVEIETDIQPGDIIHIGHHRIICGDATLPETYHRLLSEQQIDLVVTDPPYNVDYTGGTGLKIENDSMPDEQFLAFLSDFHNAIYPFIKPGGSVYVWHADSEGLNFRNAFKNSGLMMKQCLIWVKNSMVLGRQDYQWRHEPCQPAGTLVRTKAGNVPIESLKDGDEVMSFDTYGGTVKGYKNTGYKVKTASRHYKGLMYEVVVGDKKTRATDAHMFSVRFRHESRTRYCTYLMRKGNWWRVGITETYNARGFGLKTRVWSEHADEAWIISVFENKLQAQCGEQLLAVKYGIPYTHWNTGRGNDNTNNRKDENIQWIYDNLDLDALESGANRLLNDYGRNRRFPLISKANIGNRFSCRVTAKIEACNIIPGLMELPIPYKQWDTANNNTFDWEQIAAVNFNEYSEVVYSLDVDTYHHYIADGIVTHNCLYGWKPGEAHYFINDRTNTTVFDASEPIELEKLKKDELMDLIKAMLAEFQQNTIIYHDKPNRSESHPTMKPVKLMAELIINSSRPNQLICDPFLGSGSTMVAAHQLKRRCYGAELDPKYCQVIIDRMIMTEPDIQILINGKRYEKPVQTPEEGD